MKVVLDLSKLKDEGKITQAEFDKLSRYAMQETGSLAFNILVGFGIIAVTLASIALIPTALTTIVMGIILGAIGLAIEKFYPVKWYLLAQLCVVIGTLLLSSGILWLYEANTTAWILVTILLVLVGIILKHGLLIVLSVLALASAIGSSTAYEHATYFVIIDQPTTTVIVFSVLSLLLYRASLLLPAVYERLAILASRTSLFLVNLGFWIGSLWGDMLPNGVAIHKWVFATVWAVLLIGVAIWAVNANRRWVLNLCAIFGAIHFYTQWFEYLGTTPLTVLLAGITALVFAVVLRNLNIRFKK